MKSSWKFYHWISQGELWITPVIGISWPPERGKAIWFSWLIWNVAWIDDGQYCYTHIHTAAV